MTVLKIMFINIKNQFCNETSEEFNTVKYNGSKKITVNCFDDFENKYMKNNMIYECQMKEFPSEIYINSYFPKSFKFEDYQEYIMKSILENKNIVVSIPTSGGKSMIAKFLALIANEDNKVLFIINSESAMQQFVADLQIILNSVNSIKKIFLIDELVYTKNSELDACIFISTPENFFKYMILRQTRTYFEYNEEKNKTFIRTNEEVNCIDWYEFFSYVCFDDYHGCNSKVDYSLLTRVGKKIICATASISNPEEVAEYLDYYRNTEREETNFYINDDDKTQIVKHERRFINREDYEYIDGEFQSVNVLSYLSYDDFLKEEFNYKLNFTPPKLYECWENIDKIFSKNKKNSSILHDIQPKYNLNISTTPEDIIYWENNIIQVLKKLAKTDKDNFDIFLKLYKKKDYIPTSLDTKEVYDMCLSLVKENKSPILLFVDNSLKVVELGKEMFNFSLNILQRKYPLEKEIRKINNDICDQRDGKIASALDKLNVSKTDDFHSIEGKKNDIKEQCKVEFLNIYKDTITNLILKNIKIWEEELYYLIENNIKYKINNNIKISDEDKIYIKDLKFKIDYYKSEYNKYNRIYDIDQVERVNIYGTNPECTFVKDVRENDMRDILREIQSILKNKNLSCTDYGVSNFEGMFMKLIEIGIVLVTELLPREILHFSYYLIYNKKANIIISDNTLEAGVNFPVKTVIQLNYVNYKPERYNYIQSKNDDIRHSEHYDKDIELDMDYINSIDTKLENYEKPIGNIYVDPNTTQQRAGRAGRRGLDTDSYLYNAGIKLDKTEKEKCTGLDHFDDSILSKYVLSSIINKKFWFTRCLSLKQYVDKGIYKLNLEIEKAKINNNYELAEKITFERNEIILKTEDENRKKIIETAKKLKQMLIAWKIQPDLLFAVFEMENSKELIYMLNYLYSITNVENSSSVNLSQALIGVLFPGENDNYKNNILDTFCEKINENYAININIKGNDLLYNKYMSNTLGSNLEEFISLGVNVEKIYKMRDNLKKLSIIFGKGNDKYYDQITCIDKQSNSKESLELKKLREIIKNAYNFWNTVLIKRVTN